MNENEDFDFALALEKEHAAQSPATNTSGKIETPTPGLFGTSVGENSAWLNAARKPAELSRQGLKMITETIPDAKTTSVAKNIALNTPKTLAEIGSTLSSDLLSPESVITAGASKIAAPAMRFMAPAAEWLAGSLEGSSGLDNVKVQTPGLLREQFQNPSLMFKPGTAAANEMYSNINGGNSQIGQTLTEIPQHLQFVQKSLELAKNGGLGTDEALAARQSLDAIKDGIPKAFYNNARSILDPIAKQDYSGADAAYVQGMKAEALRSPMSINKNGTPSKFSLGAMFYKPWSAPLVSPAIQSAGAGAAGLAYKGAQAASEIPGVASTIEELIRQPKDFSGIIDFKRKDKNGNR